jgi:hypothetical protein
VIVTSGDDPQQLAAIDPASVFAVLSKPSDLAFFGELLHHCAARHRADGIASVQWAAMKGRAPLADGQPGVRELVEHGGVDFG